MYSRLPLWHYFWKERKVLVYSHYWCTQCTQFVWLLKLHLKQFIVRSFHGIGSQLYVLKSIFLSILSTHAVHMYFLPGYVSLCVMGFELGLLIEFYLCLCRFEGLFSPCFKGGCAVSLDFSLHCILVSLCLKEFCHCVISVFVFVSFDVFSKGFCAVRWVAIPDYLLE